MYMLREEVGQLKTIVHHMRKLFCSIVKFWDICCPGYPSLQSLTKINFAVNIQLKEVLIFLNDVDNLFTI